MTNPVTLRIRFEMIEALRRGGPNPLLTYPAVDIWAALDAGAIVITGTAPGNRPLYALAGGDHVDRAAGDAPVTVYQVASRVLIDWDNLPCFGCNEIVVPTPAHLSPDEKALRAWERQQAGLKPEGYIPWRDEATGQHGAYCFPCWGVRYALGRRS